MQTRLKRPHHLLAADRCLEGFRASSVRRKGVSTGIPDYAPTCLKVWLASGALTLILFHPSDDVGGFVRSLSLGFYCTMLTNGLTHRSPSSSLKSGPTPRLYGAFQSDHSTSSNGSSDDPPPPDTPLLAAPGPNSIQSPVLIPHLTSGPFRKRTTILAFCLVFGLLQSVLTICALARYIDLDSTAHRASREKSALIVEREKSERERQMWEWERGGWEVDKAKWELERGVWEREKGEWKSEREKLEQEEEKLRLEREWWERAREDRVPQGAFWEVVWPAWDCRAYGKREYWGALQNIPEGWTAMDACTNMPVEIKGVTVRRPDRCAFVEGSPHIHGYWTVDWDQPDCKPWYRDFHDAVSPTFPSHMYVPGVLTHLRDVQATGLAVVGSKLSS